MAGALSGAVGAPARRLAHRDRAGKTSAKERSMNDKARQERHILGTLGAADGRGVVRVEDRLDTDIDDAWSALTDPGRLARWLGRVEGDLEAGGQFRASFHDG